MKFSYIYIALFVFSCPLWGIAEERDISLMMLDAWERADSLNSEGKTAESLAVHQILCDDIRNLCGEESQEYGDVLHHYYLTLSLANRHEEARNVALVALPILEKNLSPENEDYVKEMFEIAREYSNWNMYSDQLRVMEKVIRGGFKLSAKQLWQVADAQSKNYRFTEAMETIDRAMETPESQPGGSEYEWVISKKADFLRTLGRTSEAVVLLEESIDKADKTNRTYVMLQTQLSSCYTLLGNTRRAAQLQMEIYKVDGMSDLLDNPYVMADLENDLKGGYEYIYTPEMWDYLIKEDESYLQELEDMGMRDTSDYADFLYQYAVSLYKSGNTEKAFAAVDEAIAIYKSLPGDYRADIASCTDLKGMFYGDKGDWKRSYPLRCEALEITRTLYGADSRQYITKLPAVVASASRISASGLDDLVAETSSKMDRLVRDAFASLSPTERNLYWEQNREWYTDILPSVVARNPDKRFAEYLYDGTLFSKGVLLSTEQAQTRLLKESGREDLMDEYYTLHALRMQMNTLDAEHRELRDSLELRCLAIDRRLTGASREYGDYTRSLSFRWKDVRDALQPGELAIEFVSVPDIEDQGDLAVLTLKAGMEAPGLSFIKDPEEVWPSLGNELKGVRTVYFAPAGKLYSQPIEYSDELKLLSGNDHIVALRLSSTRELLGKESRTGNGRTLILGGIDYSLGLDSVKEKVAAFRGEPDYISNVNPLLSDNSDRGLRRRYGTLPGTLAEAEGIASLFDNGKSELLIGAEATETAFKHKAGNGYSTIHIGTHGYYLPGSDGKVDLSKVSSAEAEALNRCGLAMAGINTLKELGPDIRDMGLDDGALTAEEIASLDLRGVDLVSLSACETALGDLSSEGVLGLQRGFKKAGVKSVLMSIRKVNDDATRLFMIEFYRALSEGASKNEALDKARCSLREYRRSDGTSPYASEFFTDSFILLDAI